MSSSKTPLEVAVDQAMDAFVYAPIGLIFDGPALFPKLVQHGKSQVQVARMMGQMAVQMGQTELSKRAATTTGPVRDVLSGLGLVDGAKSETETAAEPVAEPVAEAPKKTAAKRARAAGKTAPRAKSTRAASATKRARTAATKRASTAVESLGIPDYDSLSASQVVQRLRGLVPEELDAVKAYEAATRGRKTVLNKIVQLQKD